MQTQADGGVERLLAFSVKAIENETVMFAVLDKQLQYRVAALQ
jgi:hypothetical protein